MCVLISVFAQLLVMASDGDSKYILLKCTKVVSLLYCILYDAVAEAVAVPNIAFA